MSERRPEDVFSSLSPSMRMSTCSVWRNIFRGFLLSIFSLQCSFSVLALPPFLPFSLSCLLSVVIQQVGADRQMRKSEKKLKIQRAQGRTGKLLGNVTSREALRSPVLKGSYISCCVTAPSGPLCAVLFYWTLVKSQWECSENILNDEEPFYLFFG